MIGGKLWCWLRGHRWGKPFRDVAPDKWMKLCRRCLLTKEVKRRAKQEKGI